MEIYRNNDCSHRFFPSPEVLDFLVDTCNVDERHLSSAIGRLIRLAELLEENNQRYNLTRLTEPDEFWLKHVADSMAIGRFLPCLGETCWRVADIGCGAGFPLLPLACFFPNLHLVGIETTGKRVEFIGQASMRMQLSNVKVVHQQAREAAVTEGFSGAFDLVTARAVGTAGRLLRHGWKLLKRTAPAGGRMVLYKTPQASAEEQEELERECRKLGFSWRFSSLFTLPRQAGQRQFIEIRTSSNSAEIRAETKF